MSVWLRNAQRFDALPLPLILLIDTTTLPPKIPSLPPLPLMASSDANHQQQTWLPYDPAKDCSQGFCSIYCPQWCYIIFPPPPPFSFVDDDDSSSGTTFSPLVIAIIGILASALLLISYYTIISKYCGRFRRRRRRRHGDPLGPGDAAVGDEGGGDQSRRHEAWHALASNGLDEALIGKITVYKYRRGEGLVDGTDCSVCLGEFREEESLRLLPKCSHAFHVECIDTWLRSHSNCPLCRANIVSLGPLPPQLPAPPLLSSETRRVDVEVGRDDETVIAIEDLEEGTSSESDGMGSKENLEADQGSNHRDIIEIRDDEGVQQFRRSFSVGSSSRRGRVSIADVLQQSMEEEFMVAKDQGLLAGSGYSSRRRGENSSKGSGRSRSSHCVISPVPMKRSISNGQMKVRSSVLPI